MNTNSYLFIVLFYLVLFSLINFVYPTYAGNQAVGNAVDIKNQIERLNSSNPIERGDAAFKIGTMGECAKEAIPFLVQLLGDVSAETEVKFEENDRRITEDVRRYKFPGEVAAESLAKIGDETTNFIVSASNDGKLPNTPFASDHAAHALSCIGIKAVEPLIAALKSKNDKTRVLATKALGQIEDDRMVEHFIEIVTNKRENVEVRKTVAYYLGTKKDARVADILIAIIKDHSENNMVRGFAAIGVGHVKEDRVIDALIYAIGDISKIVRVSARVALFDSIGKDAVDPLINELKHSDNPLRRASAAYILGRIKNPKAIDSLKAAMHDENANVRSNAEQALSNMGIANQGAH